MGFALAGKTTLRYDHVSDDMVRDYFANQISISESECMERKMVEKQTTGICFA